MIEVGKMCKLETGYNFGNIKVSNERYPHLGVKTTSQRLRITEVNAIQLLTKAIEAKDLYTRIHSERVKNYSLRIGRCLKLTKKELFELEVGSLLHDVGKIGIPEQVLNKKSYFSEAEYKIVKKHPIIGQEILRQANLGSNAQSIVLQHHERLDGKGYPYGLKGNEIAYLAKIVSVADAYDAMTSSRIYKIQPLTGKAALIELENNKGTQFEASIVDALRICLNGNSLKE